MNNSQAPYAGGYMPEKIPSGYKKGTLNNFDQQQTGLYNQQFAHLGPDSYLNRLASGDQFFFDEMEAPAMRQFQGLLGGLGSRFSGMGSQGARNSSGFQNTASSAASNFAQDLQSKRQDYRRQALQDLMSMSNTILGQRPQDNFLVRKQQKQSPWNSFAQGLGGALPGLATGNLFGAAMGGLGGFMSGAQSSPITNELDMGFRSGAPGYY